MQEFTYLNHLAFQHLKIEQWVRKKCAKRLLKPTAQKHNRWVLALYKNQMHTDQQNNVSIEKVNPLVGYGVFAQVDIPALTYIGEYTGVVRKKRKRKDLFNNYIFRYQIGSKEAPYIIDAQDQGNFTRFLNHSLEPNLTSRWIIHDGITHIIFYSNKLIRKGEQMTYDYGPIYWRSRSHPVSL